MRDTGQHGLAPRANLLRTGNVVVASHRETAELLETVGIDRRPRGDVPVGEAGKGGLAKVRNDVHAGRVPSLSRAFHPIAPDEIDDLPSGRVTSR